MQLARLWKGQGSCNSCNSQLWEGSPAPGCTCQGTPTRALPGQELPSLSVDSEMEFAILNRARVHRQHNGTASASVPVNSSFPCSSGARPFPHSSCMSTAMCCFKRSPAGPSTDTMSYLGEHLCHVLGRAPGVLREPAAPPWQDWALGSSGSLPPHGAAAALPSLPGTGLTGLQSAAKPRREQG